MDFILENKLLRVTVSSKGAELTSVIKKETGEELLWTADPAVWPRHAPILFPHCGRVKDGFYICKGTRYESAQHGFARELEHTLDTEDTARLTLCLEANALTMEKFPYAFKLYSSFWLEENTLHHGIEVVNDGDEPLPFSFGYHPGFLCPFDAQHTVNDYVLRFDTPETPEVICCGESTGLVTGETYTYFKGETDIPLTDSLFDHDSICFSQLKSNTLSIVEKDTGRSVDVGIAGYPYVLIWSAKGPLRYVCIEPWHSLPDSVNDGNEWESKNHTATLAPAERWSTQLDMTFNR